MQWMQTYVKDTLESALAPHELTVDYAYPQKWASNSPSISFCESNNSSEQTVFDTENLPEGETQHAYPTEAIQRVSYSVDIWSNSPSVNWMIFAVINRAMCKAGFVRISSGDLYETDTRLHHRTSMYQAKVNLLANEIT